jgi:4'-phosphopantetheinyl transferase
VREDVMKKILKYCFNTNKWSPTKTEWLHLLCTLPKEERERISRYMFKRDQKQTLLGQLLIRHALRQLLNIKWSHLTVQRDAKNRPFLNQAETARLAGLKTLFKTNVVVDFNVTHAGDYASVVAAVAAGPADSCAAPVSGLGFRLGADMMKIDVARARLASPADTSLYGLYEAELSAYSRVLNAKFGDAERAFVQSKSNAVERLTAFYRLWCLKESYAKAIGEGVGFDLRRIECSISSDLFIDLSSSSPMHRNKCLVVDSTHVLVDAKPVRNARFYEQYFLNRIEDSLDHLSELYILTFCVIDSNECGAPSSPPPPSENHVLEEFKEVTLSDVMGSAVVVEPITPVNSPEFEKSWAEFCDKAEQPYTPVPPIQQPTLPPTRLENQQT